VPAISESRALEDFKSIRDKIRLGFRAAMIINFPCFVGLFFLAEKVAGLIYNAPGAAGAIQTMSMGILFLGMHQISTGVLQGLEHTAIPVINMILAGVVKVVLSWWLTALPELGVKGAAWATVADFAVAAILNMCFIYKYTGFCMTFGSVAKPLLSSGIMGGVIFVVLHFTESFGAWAILFAMAAAVPTYGFSLLACGGLHQEDLEGIPFIGRRILALGKRMGVF
jgi:stage V sporulation protein B